MSICVNPPMKRPKRDPNIPHMTTMPKDCVQSIIQWLDCSSALSLASTCRSLYDVVCQCPMVDPLHIQPVDFTKRKVTGFSTWNAPLLQAQVFPRLRYIVTDTHTLLNPAKEPSYKMNDILSDTAPLQLWFEISHVATIESRCLRAFLCTANISPTPWLDRIEAVHLFHQSIDSQVMVETLAWIPSITFSVCDFGVEDLTVLGSRNRLHTLCIDEQCIRQWDKADRHADSRKVTLPFAKTLEYPVDRFEYNPCNGQDDRPKTNGLQHCHVIFPYPEQEQPNGLIVCASSWTHVLSTVQETLFVDCMDEGNLDFAEPICCSELRVSGWLRLFVTEAPNLQVLRLESCDLESNVPAIFQGLRELYLVNSSVPNMLDGDMFQSMVSLEILELDFGWNFRERLVISDMPCLHTMRLQVPYMPVHITDNPCLERLDLYRSTNVALLGGNPRLHTVHVHLVEEHYLESDRVSIVRRQEYLKSRGVATKYWHGVKNLGWHIWRNMETFSTRKHWPRLQNLEDNIEEIAYEDIFTVLF